MNQIHELSKPYEREVYVDSFHGSVIFKLVERPMLDPRFDLDPIEKILMLDTYKGWVDVTGKLTPKQEAAVMGAWQRSYDKDFCDTEVTRPMF